MVKLKGALIMLAKDIGKPATIAKWKQASKCQCASSTWGLDKLKKGILSSSSVSGGLLALMTSITKIAKCNKQTLSAQCCQPWYIGSDFSHPTKKEQAKS